MLVQTSQLFLEGVIQIAPREDRDILWDTLIVNQFSIEQKY